MKSLCCFGLQMALVSYQPKTGMFYRFYRVATFFREIGRSDSKIHMLMSEVVNKLFVEGFVKKTSTS